MGRFTRVLLAALASLALCAPIAYATSGPSDDVAHSDRPEVSGRSAINVSDSAATLRAAIDAEGDDDDDDGGGSGGATYRFLLGPTTAYGSTTASGTLYGDSKKVVSVQVTGLSPGTSYHFRAVASNASGTTFGPDGLFRTSGSAAGTGPSPELGRTVVAHTLAGEVWVREPGSSEFQPLGSEEAMPVNSTFDTRQGTVLLETARRDGASQTGNFWGGKFRVRQSPSGNGMTVIALRGGNFASCTSGRSARVPATYRSNKTQRKLWAKDKGGRFKTSGKGSVATVRGTSWYTADRCDGTLTRVKHGKVLVRERGTGRRELLTRGESFLARFPR